MCGIFGLWFLQSKNKKKIINQAYQMIKHRGRESVGISYLKENNLKIDKKMGSVDSFLNNYNFNLESSHYTGHIRYSTSKGKTKDIDKKLREAQPFVFNDFTIIHNGNIPFHICDRLRERFNCNSETNSDTELLGHLLNIFPDKTMKDKLIRLLNIVQGVYSLIIMTKDSIYALRDSFGVRPLYYHSTMDYHHISSELNLDIYHEVKSGSLIQINHLGIKEIYKIRSKTNHFCSFEQIYFMDRRNPMISSKRYLLGYKMALNEDNIIRENAIVIGCPNSAIPAGKGFSEAAKLPYVQAIQKRKECGRTFILPENNKRKEFCNKRTFIEKNMVKDKHIYLIDDSIVRGNTSSIIIKKLRNSGALSVHIRITSPPVRFPCHYGIDFPSYKELIAHNKTEEQIKEEIGADSIRYCTIKEMMNILEPKKNKGCVSCFSGEYLKELMDW